ncbi:hypothetical protein MMC30_008103 [Trapelia coarctata]|nr:hypothetical protein [Trapelia coarctata]
MSPGEHPTARGLGSSLSRNNNFTAGQILIEQALAITCAGISILAGSVASYWFIRMRRTFRHKLIMLLIQSDLLKAIWYFTFPLVSFARGPVPSGSAYCQITGFFVALGTEASDFAILMIAIHAAMYVFQSSAATTEAGLYNYRYITYTCWIIYPVLMASLAFTNPMDPYLSSGTICSLPVRPFWYRLALSWIPRYLIIFAILFLYVAIYVYVHYKFKGIDGETNGSYKLPSRESRNSVKAVETNEGIVIPAFRTNRPTTPEAHCLLHESAPRGESETRKEPGQQGLSSTAATPAWEGYNFGGFEPVSPLTEGTSTLRITQPDRRISTTSSSANAEALREPSHSTTGSRSSGNYHIIKALRDSRIKSFTPTSGSDARSSSKAENLPANVQPAVDGADDLNPVLNRDTQADPVGVTSLRKRHKDIKRKLRLLFIYPIVYVVMWTIPFVSHCLQYTESYGTDPPFPLTVLAVMCLALQGAVDSLLFSSREKPWRYVRHGRLFPWGQAPPGGRLRRLSGGSNLEESIEVAERSNEEQGQSKSKDTRNTPIKKEGQHWWDVEGRMRVDSVMLGTDHNCEDHGERPSQGPVPRRSPIEEEGEEPTPQGSHTETQRKDPKPRSGRRGYEGLHVGGNPHHGSKGWHASKRTSRASEGSRSINLEIQGGSRVQDVEQGRRASLGLPGEQEERRGLGLSGVPGTSGSLKLPADIQERRESIGSPTRDQGRRRSAVTFTEDTKTSE